MMIHDRTGFRLRIHRHGVQPEVVTSAISSAADAIGEPVTSRAQSLPAASFVPGGDARLLRRLRHVVRRRVRVNLDGLVSASASDGELTLRIEAVSHRDPRIIAWSADRLVALVVLHDGCGARAIGGGGVMGRLELPSVLCAGAFLAFCYDAEAAAPLS
jgi:hypothetical protein